MQTANQILVIDKGQSKPYFVENFDLSWMIWLQFRNELFDCIAPTTIGKFGGRGVTFI